MSALNRKSFLIAAVELGGHLSPMLVTARKLLDQGHDVRVLSELCHQGEVEAIGAQFIPWRSAPSRPTRTRESEHFDDWACATPQEGIALLVDRIVVGAIDAYVADVQAELSRKPADLVIAADFLFGAMIACEALKQPFAAFSANLAIDPPPGVPPFGPGLMPARDPAEAAMHDEIARGGAAMFDAFLPKLNAARARHGLAPLRHLLDQMAQGEKHLIAVAPSFDFPATSMPDRLAFVGPQLGEPAWASAWVAPFPATPERKRALVAFSTTFQNHVGVLQRIIDAARDLPLDLVVTLGGPIEARELSGAPNVAILDSAAHAPAMADSDFVVTHGGHGTVCKALISGKPLLILPHGRDQADNAARVVARGAGLSLPATADQAEIAGALSQLMSEASFATAAKRLGAAIARDSERSPIVPLLEELAHRGRRCRPEVTLIAA